MVFNPAKDTELASGYRLTERLGVGGYGEVWKATAPGGLMKAVKIVYGDTAGPQAEQELKALNRIKEVRHPFLLSIERIEVLDGRLLIVTELAEGSLADRFSECRKTGLPGIPRDELLAHLRDASEALDYMAQTHGLQHLDVKPQNLLLVGNRMKVADFGLVRQLKGAGTISYGVTPIYAAPEVFDGRVSQHSDQYSLAIVYQEMLTGARPFPGSSLMQLAAQHISSPPLLTPLPPGDRFVIAKGLAKSFEQRFPSCSKLVEALRAGGWAGGFSSVAQTHSTAKAEARPSVSSNGSTVANEPAGIANDLEGDVLQNTVLSPVEAEVVSTIGQRDAFEIRPEAKPGLRPTLFLGIGGLGGEVLRRLRKRLSQKYGDLTKASIFRFLLLDTDRDELRQVRQDNPLGSLDVADTLLTPLHSPEHYRQESKRLLRWLDRRWLYGIPRSLLTDRVRPLGRLAFVDNAAEILSRIRESLTHITGAEAIASTTSAAGTTIRDDMPRIFVIASITGGTGSGMVVGLAYAVRQILSELGLSTRGLCSMLLYATSPKPEDREMARVNASATLSELDLYGRSDTAYPGDPDAGLISFRAGQGPFEESYLVNLGDQLDRDTANTTTETIADYLYLNSCSDSGAFFDQFRQQTNNGSRESSDHYSLRTFGLSRIDARSECPLNLMSCFLCRRLIEKWLAEPSYEEMKDLHHTAERQAASLGLEERNLALLLQTTVNNVTANRPGEIIPQLLAKTTVVSDVRHLKPEHIDKIFTAENDTTSDLVALPFHVVVRKTAEQYGMEISRSLVEWLAHTIEVPGKRFKVAARTATFLTKKLGMLIKTVRGRLDRVRTERRALRRQIEAKGQSNESKSGSRWSFRSTTPPPPLRTDRELEEYCRLRLREMAEDNTVTLLTVVQRQIDTFLQDVEFCCQYLKNLLPGFRPGIVRDSTSSRPEDDRLGQEGLAAVLESTRSLTADILPFDLVPQFDREIQDTIFEKAGGLRGMLSRTDDPFNKVVPVSRPTPEQFTTDLLARARTIIQSSIKDVNTARLFLQMHGGSDEALPVLLAHVEAAKPRLQVNGSWQHLVVAVPKGPSGDILNRILAKSLSHTQGSLVHTDEEVILCFETAGCPLPAISQALIGPSDIPDELVRSMMTCLTMTPSPASGSAETPSN